MSDSFLVWDCDWIRKAYPQILVLFDLRTLAGHMPSWKTKIERMQKVSIDSGKYVIKILVKCQIRVN